MVQLGLCLFAKNVLKRFPVCSSTGGGYLLPHGKIIRLAKKGCTNRHFFHVVITNRWRNRDSPIFEQLGTYDPIPNDHNEKLLSLNLERIRYWIGQGAIFSAPVYSLLGLIGFLPIFPRTRTRAWRARREAQRKALEEEETKQKQEASSASAS